jgi:hypothetical protein
MATHLACRLSRGVTEFKLAAFAENRTEAWNLNPYAGQVNSCVAGPDSSPSASPTDIGLKGYHGGFLEYFPSLIRLPSKSTLRL